MKCDQQMCNYYPLPERSKESEVLKIAVRDDKCRGGTTILAGAEVIQGDQLRGSGAGGACRAVVCLSVCLLRCELVRAP